MDRKVVSCIQFEGKAVGALRTDHRRFMEGGQSFQCVHPRAASATRKHTVTDDPHFLPRCWLGTAGRAD